MKPRPRKLDLSKNTRLSSGNPASAVPMSAREGFAIQEVGIACLSPGFSTHDPVMKEQLQRSLSVRDQQRSIIESRLQQSAKGDGPGDREPGSGFAAKTPGMSHRNKAPPGLSIVAPSHEQFANERVIQSAPLGHSFAGRQHAVPASRHVTNQSSNLAGSSHIHHVPAHQTRNRLPPISDVFGHSTPAHTDNAPTSGRAPMTSPGHSAVHQYQQPPGSARGREYKSAEDAQQELAGGRPELIPKIVHYGGHQPPTPRLRLQVVDTQRECAAPTGGAPAPSTRTVSARPWDTVRRLPGAARLAKAETAPRRSAPRRMSFCDCVPEHGICSTHKGHIYLFSRTDVKF